jgi:hypothetical protein
MFTQNEQEVIMFTIGNDEIENCPLLKERILCHRCGLFHKVRYAKDRDGNETKMLAYYKCSKDSYLCGINGKDITRRQKNVQ